MNFENEQWRVTTGGLETTAPVPMVYVAAADLLQERGVGGDSLYEWPLHFADNSWTNFPAFADAFTAALKHHKKGPDSARLQRSLDAGAKRAAEIVSKQG